MRRWLRTGIFLIVSAAAAYYFTQLHFLLIRQLDGAYATDLLRGTASVPYQYRALVPWLARLLIKAGYPAATGSTLANVFFMMEALFVMLSLLSFRYYLSFFMEERASYLLAFSFLYAMFFNFTLPVFAALRYPSDVPSVFFFILGLILLYKGKLLLYYIVFVAATFNRETTCFLIVVYLLASWGKRPFRTILLHVVLQSAIWLYIKYLLFHIYLENSGAGLFEHHFWFNISFFTEKLSNYPFFLSTMGFAWVPCVFYYRLIENRFLKRALLAVFPFVAGMMYVGNIFELRLHAELIPVVLPASLVIVRRLLREAGTQESGRASHR